MMLRYFRGVAIAAAIGCAAPLLAQSVDLPDAEVEADSADDASEGEAQVIEETASAEPAISDLDRAYAAYALCADEAGRALTEAGEAPEVVGVRALAACGEERAAYVNAFYFMLLPQAGDLEEAELRVRAERLVSQTDSFLIAKLGEGAATPANATDAEAPADEASPSE